MSKKIPVSEKAVLARVNRRLDRDDQAVKKTRRKSIVSYIGEYTRVDYRRGGVVENHVDLEALAREVGALEPWETMEEQ